MNLHHLELFIQLIAGEPDPEHPAPPPPKRQPDTAPFADRPPSPKRDRALEHWRKSR